MSKTTSGITAISREDQRKQLAESLGRLVARAYLQEPNGLPATGDEEACPVESAGKIRSRDKRPAHSDPSLAPHNAIE
jgi:hypothetical protein